jgi:hypothetical protein
MAVTKVDFKPGLNREGTAYSAEGTFYDGDKIRFRSGKAEKIGGWVRLSSISILGNARALINWGTLGG